MLSRKSFCLSVNYKVQHGDLLSATFLKFFYNGSGRKPYNMPRVAVAAALSEWLYSGEAISTNYKNSDGWQLKPKQSPFLLSLL